MSFSTLEVKVAYHKAITKETGLVRAEETIVTMGGRTAFTDARRWMWMAVCTPRPRQAFW
jgi:acyl-coenzyme A thioesterase PaaI-like protein